jgi:hypothetical protein
MEVRNKGDDMFEDIADDTADNNEADSAFVHSC